MNDLKVPQDVKAEMAILGLILNNNSVLDELILKSDDFYSLNHQVIYQSMVDLHKDNKTIDLISLSDANEHFTVDLYNQLTTMSMYSSEFKHWQDIVLEKSKLRKYITIMQESIDLAFQGIDPSSEFKKLEDVETTNDSEIVSISEVTLETVEYIEYLQSKRGYEGLTSGLRLLDYKLDGFKKQGYYVLAARPSQGKTALALQIANAVSQQGNKVAIFSLEMGRLELCKRLIVSESQTHLKLIKDKKLETQDYQKINKAADTLNRQNIFIDDEFDQTISRIYRQAKRLKKRKGLDMIIIDYLQLLTPDGKFNSKNEEVSYNSRWLKKIAKNLDVPVICLSQLSRACEQRSDKRPMLSDIRDSGSVEQDADCVMFLYRDDYYHQNDPTYTNDNIAEIIIAKNRGGETGTVKKRWNGGLQSFYNDL